MTLNINTRVADRAAIESTDRGVRSEVGSGKSEVGRSSSAFVVGGFPETLFFFF